ncbi:MAG TPA: DUF5916 domain-containing protein [Candidatus Eisenbacteria bacterium]
MPMPLATPRAAPAALAVCLLLAACASASRAADPRPGPLLTIRRATGPIVVDGDLSDAGWRGADSVTTWFETRIGDNVEPQVRNLGFLAYDDHYLYAAFRFDDPHPELIRAPLGDHDALSGLTDYGGVIVDSRNDGKTAVEFLTNPNGLQYDAINSDVTGEDSSPDFFWDSKGKITKEGYTLELRIPFTSLRYANTPVQTWGILLYRNYPRERHYQFFTARLPRDVNCFICNSSKLTGLEQLPHGSHLVVAPFATTQQTAAPPEDGSGNVLLGEPLAKDKVKSTSGADIKWSPLSGLAVDGTLKPDFSQVESDAAQIVANERFALFFPEKRSFFLEGVDLFSTPFQAVYTRTVTSPDFGLRATGRAGTTAFTALVARDRGQGQVILPGPLRSDAADQDFRSGVGVLRVRHDMGQSFVSLLATSREIEGGGHNRVLGPDFQWRMTPTDKFTGQVLWSDSRTPNRPDLAAEWDGRTLQDHALVLNWSHPTPTYDLFLQAQELGHDFRADDGFIPQVGYREGYYQGGYTIRPKQAFFNRVRIFSEAYEDVIPGGDVLARHAQLGAGADGKVSSFSRIELNRDEFRVGGRLLKRFRPHLHFDASLGRVVNSLSFDADLGDEIDFANAREGHGATLAAGASVRPGNHVEVQATSSVRWLDVHAGPGLDGRLLTAQVERLRTTYTLNAQSFARLIVQHVRTDRDPVLYTSAVGPRDQHVSLSGLFAYKVNWQTVLYVGYGDQRTFLDATRNMERAGRQLFAKISYAWQQ